ncbi:unnamed protein product [Nezara viridula]|uniref:C2H2-type domain-containing protein n=1 Tax=Nezara viridula TaxID=85310 RepID=A0A9P0GZD1_NEZVI|nr:unnamed protein product [Nezara viridula]
MLAAQFLNVVLEENDKTEGEHSDELHENNNNININYILSQLDIKSQLAKILMSECIIEPSKIAQKREKPVLSFEANVTPIYETPAKKTKTNNEQFALNAVEAVYSDGEEDGDSQAVPCPVCNRSFSRNCSLALHLKSHDPLEDASKRFQCQLCPRSYSQKSVLKKHLAVHTGERERCAICGAGFSQRSSLVRHAKRIHGGLLNSQQGTQQPATVHLQPVAQHASISTQTSNSCVLLLPNNGQLLVNNVHPPLSLKPSLPSSTTFNVVQPSSSVLQEDQAKVNNNVHHVGVP